MWKTILFDLDGTLTDSAEGITKSAQYALAKQGIDEPDHEKLRGFIGPPLHRYFMKYAGFTAEQAAQAVSDYRAYYNASGMYMNRVFEGIPAMLIRLKNAGRRLAVVTSKETNQAVAVLRQFGLLPYFEAVIGCNPDNTNAAKDSLIRRAMNTLGVAMTPDEVVMVGDRFYDIEGAAKTGVASIGVLYGYGSREELERYAPKAIAHDVDDLTKLLLTGQPTPRMVPRSPYDMSVHTLPPQGGMQGGGMQQQNGAYGVGGYYRNETPQGGAMQQQNSAYGAGMPQQNGMAAGGSPQQNGMPQVGGAPGHTYYRYGGYQGDVRLRSQQEEIISRGAVSPKQEGIGRRIWNISYPILIWLLVQNVIASVLVSVMGYATFMRDYAPNTDMTDFFAIYQAMNEAMLGVNGMMDKLIIISAIADVVIIPIVYLMFRKDEQRRGRLLTWRTIKSPGIGHGITVVLWGFFISTTFNLFLMVSGLSQWMYEMNPSRYDMLSSLSPGLLFVVVCILAPVVEELLFRGIVFRRMRAYWGTTIAMVFSALIFGIVHLDIITGIAAFVIGLIMALIYERTGSLLASMLFHFGFNFYSVAVEILPLEGIPDVAFVVALVVAAILAVVLGILFFRKNNQSKLTEE